MSYNVDIHFYRVGHGLFSYGQIKNDKNSAIYTWVYDCGSHSKRLINKSIKTYKNINNNAETDLLVISHFHRDHINGVQELLKQIRVKTILLPYIPVWQRLLIGLYYRKYDNDYWNFLQNPRAFFSDKAPESTQVYVYRKDDEDGLKIEEIPPLREGVAVDSLSATQRCGIVSGTPIVTKMSSVWTFIPYNSPCINGAIPLSFKQSARTLMSQLVNASGTTAAVNYFSQLKNTYRDAIKNQNRSSLFLLGEAYGNHRTLLKKGILYTGDGFLKNVTDFDDLEKIMGKLQSRVSCFQVMHHGSSYNWHQGLAAKIAPDNSIIGANPPSSGYPPHPNVIKDFSNYGLEILGKHGSVWQTNICL